MISPFADDHGYELALFIFVEISESSHYRNILHTFVKIAVSHRSER